MIPILEDGDITLFGKTVLIPQRWFVINALLESRAICRYIAETYADQGTKLVPARGDIKAQAIFDQWLSVESTNWDAFAYPLVNQKLFRKCAPPLSPPRKSVNKSTRYRGLEPIPEVVDSIIPVFNDKLDIFEKILGKQKYMAGDEFSLVDLFYLPYTAKLFEIGHGDFLTSRPNVSAWWDRVSNRESWKKVYVPMPLPPA
jgi:glutathione S-transferase